MIRRLAVLSCVLAAAAGALPAAGSDLDELMGRVLLKRDDNWKKLQQYVLEERETMEVTAIDGRKIYGFKREYQWFPRQGFFIKSPLTADGVKIGRMAHSDESDWLERDSATMRQFGSFPRPLGTDRIQQLSARTVLPGDAPQGARATEVVTGPSGRRSMRRTVFFFAEVSNGTAGPAKGAVEVRPVGGFEAAVPMGASRGRPQVRVAGPASAGSGGPPGSSLSPLRPCGWRASTPKSGPPTSAIFKACRAPPRRASWRGWSGRSMNTTSGGRM